MGSLDAAISTEEAVVVFAVLSGVGGAISQSIAGRNLSQYPQRKIQLRYVMPAVIASVAASSLAAYWLIPGDSGTILT